MWDSFKIDISNFIFVFQVIRYNCKFSAQIKVFVTGLFALNQEIPRFREHIRDFLVQIRVSNLTYSTGLLQENVCHFW